MTRTLLALVCLLAPLSAQVVGFPFGLGTSLTVYGSAKPGGSLNHLAILAGTTAAWVVLSLDAEPSPYLFPIDPSAGYVLIDANPPNVIGAFPMVTVSLPGTDWGYLFQIQNDPALSGTIIFAQCSLVDSSSSWHLSHAWLTPIQ